MLLLLFMYIKEQATKDAAYTKLLEGIKSGLVTRYQIEDGLIRTKGNRLYVPASGELRNELLRETHDTLWA